MENKKLYINYSRKNLKFKIYKNKNKNYSIHINNKIIFDFMILSLKNVNPIKKKIFNKFIILNN